jgi:hypothetical protein
MQIRLFLGLVASLALTLALGGVADAITIMINDGDDHEIIDNTYLGEAVRRAIRNPMTFTLAHDLK